MSRVIQVIDWLDAHSSVSVGVAVLSLVIAVIVAALQRKLDSKIIVQGEYAEKKKVVLSTINLITEGSKHNFSQEIMEKFWEETVVGRHLFGSDVATFITTCGNKYAAGVRSMEDKPEAELDGLMCWFFHQRSVAHDKFDRYFGQIR